MFEALANIDTAPPAALVVQAKKKRSNGNRSSRNGWVVPTAIIGTWVLLRDGRECKVSAIKPDGSVLCAEFRQPK